jgi:hypothetical protein
VVLVAQLASFYNHLFALLVMLALGPQLDQPHAPTAVKVLGLQLLVPLPRRLVSVVMLEHGQCVLEHHTLPNALQHVCPCCIISVHFQFSRAKLFFVSFLPLPFLSVLSFRAFSCTDRFFSFSFFLVLPLNLFVLLPSQSFDMPVDPSFAPLAFLFL